MTGLTCKHISDLDRKEGVWLFNRICRCVVSWKFAQEHGPLVTATGVVAGSAVEYKRSFLAIQGLQRPTTDAHT